MSLWKIAWRSIQQRALASTLTAISMALGVMLVVAVLVMSSVVQNSFASGNSLGYNMIVGAKGGRLDLLLNTVYYLNRPIANIPWSYYKEFFPAAQRSDHKDGKYAAYVDLAIPLCLGDFLGEQAQFRVVGTNPEMFTKLLHSKFRSGEVFKENDYATAVVGAEVADDLHLSVGGDILPIHGGVGGEKHMPFRITGILARTGTPNDRAAFVNIEGFFLIPDHARGHVEEPKPPPGEPEPKEEMLKTPLPENMREVTAVLLRGSSAGGMLPELATIDLVKEINREDIAQAILPVQEIRVLTDTFVQPLVVILLALTVLIVIISGVSIMVSIYNSMSERRHEIAVMRALGARRATVMLVVLFESILLAMGGGVIGWFAGHLLVGAASPWITTYTGVASGFLQFAPFYELILIPALILLASLVGYLPALAAYRTDIGAALTATP
jgi:putative ABC transport system permease protein